jgi:hypothetical protein
MRVVQALIGALLAAGIADARASAPVTVRFETTDPVPTVTAVLNGQRFRLFIDLGGYASLALTHRAATSAGSVPIEGTTRYTTAIGTQHVVPRFRIDSFRISTTDFGPIEGDEFPSSPEGFDGYLGYGWLRRYVVVFDYGAGQMRLYPAGDGNAISKECPSTNFALGQYGNIVTSVFQLQQQPVTFALDTGESQNTIRPAVARQKDGSVRFPLFAGDVNLGSMPFHVVDFKEPDVAGVLGTDFFKGRVVLF